jgi:hypothetical protein
MEDKRLVKVQFYDQDIGYENIWVLPLGDGTYCLQNPPFFIYDIALNDVVAAVPDEDCFVHFLRVVRRSGNRTLRARSDFLLQDSEFMSKVKRGLCEMQCQVEAYRNRLLAISVPQEADLHSVMAYLAEMGLAWEYGCPSELNT